MLFVCLFCRVTANVDAIQLATCARACNVPTIPKNGHALLLIMLQEKERERSSGECENNGRRRSHTMAHHIPSPVLETLPQAITFFNKDCLPSIRWWRGTSRTVPRPIKMQVLTTSPPSPHRLPQKLPLYHPTMTSHRQRIRRTTQRFRYWQQVPVVVNPNELVSAVARPDKLTHCDPGHSKPRLAAELAWGIIMNHPFVDGNKRTAFPAANSFLREKCHSKLFF